MNKVILIGNLTADVELRTNDKGTSVVRATVAINNGKDENGNERPTDFLLFYAFNKVAENLSKFCEKGSKIAIEGRLKNRSWDKQDGTKGYETAVYANNITFLNPRRSSDAPLPEELNYSTQENVQETDPFANFGEEVVINEDDLPF